MMSETPQTIEVQINGEHRQIPSGLTIDGFIRLIDRNPETPGVAVAVNAAVVHRSSWNEKTLQSGDRVEVITASQGG